MDTIPDLPSTQTPGEAIPQLFHGLPSDKRQVFVDPGGILGRPKLVRLLKKSGAYICSDPKYAQFILVDSISDTGRQFIRDWGLDADKVVLEHRWVAKSIAARRLLMKNDEWGGCSTHDDGLPIGKQTKDDMDESPNPLPTPRVTPIELAPSNGRDSSLSRPHPSSSQRIRAESTQSRPARSRHTPPERGLSASPTSTASGASANQPQFPQRQQSMMPQYPMTQSIIQQFSQGDMMQQLSQLQPGQGNMMPMYSQLFGQSSPLYTEHTLAMSLLDVLKSHGLNIGLSQGPSTQNNAPQPPFFPQSQLNSGIQPPLGQPSQHTFGRNPDHAEDSDHTSVSEPPSSRGSPSSGLPPSLRRKSPPATPLRPISHSRSKGKGREIDSLGTKRSSGKGPMNNLPLKSQGPPSKIFITDSGRELAFFVQIDLSNRLSVVNNIKKYGGKITNNHTIADFSILYSRSKTFPDLLNSTVAAKKPAVSAAFVHDSVAQNRLLDSTDYLFDVPTSSKRKRPRAPTILASEAQQDKAQRRKEENAKWKAERKKKKQEEDMAMEGIGAGKLPSPSPPPENTRVQWQRDKYRFSDHEREFLSLYVQFLVKENPFISNTAISQKLYQKMPHHSFRSWNAYVSTIARDEVEAIRRKLGIARRKVESADKAHEEQPQWEGLGDVIPDGSGSSIGMELTATDEVHEEKDFNTICDFFASGAGDEGSDDEIWARLTEKRKCLSAPSWPIYYQRYAEEVTAKLEELAAAAERRTE